MSNELLNLLATATAETLYMVLVSGVIALIGGLPLGILLLITRREGIAANFAYHQGLSMVVNVVRAIPFIILLVLLIPLTRLIVGTSIGINAAIVPLSIGAIPFVARIVENALVEVGEHLIETGYAMGASIWQIIAKILLPEALPAITNGVTLTLISLVGYSAMAGAVGGGGLGSVAINYGYQLFNPTVMFATTIILIVIVYVIQYVGEWLAKRLSKR